MPGGNWRRGRATSPSQIFGPEQLSIVGAGGYNDLPVDQEKSQPAFLPEAQSILPCSAYPACLPATKGLKSQREATPAGQDMGKREGGFYKQIYSNIESEGREGKRVGEAEAGPQKGKQQLVQWLRK
ncbi:hypothetical protein mRhiFer1_010244 [Rhinolophus ferrumequinum]|uniref:Uncharacterized protein n=1 Tax=Rhinolophus ferrumequinum TaxID=59479 RepID=A0A7J7X5P5_RHIFE|nr:hypothetical protein mRhiFer1_010244 [Rhinolophus ferrumequinum]